MIRQLRIITTAALAASTLSFALAAPAALAQGKAAEKKFGEIYSCKEMAKDLVEIGWAIQQAGETEGSDSPQGKRAAEAWSFVYGEYKAAGCSKGKATIQTIAGLRAKPTAPAASLPSRTAGASAAPGSGLRVALGFMRAEARR